MRLTAILLGGLMLAACGVDGEPVQPTADANVYVTSRGVSVGTNLGVQQGPISLNLGLSL